MLYGSLSSILPLSRLAVCLLGKSEDSTQQHLVTLNLPLMATAHGRCWLRDILYLSLLPCSSDAAAPAVHT